MVCQGRSPYRRRAERTSSSGRGDGPRRWPEAGSACERLQAIRDELLSPPKLIDLFRLPVETCAPSDTVGASARKMHDGSFSQLPVYDGHRLVGLLTAEAVARWLASRLAGGLGLLEEAVEIAMRHEEGTHAYVVMYRDATVEDALTALDDHLRSSRSLDAIILTHNGRENKRPLGIVTVSDIPKLLGPVRA